jgi:radical SAM superfamily enzyme YgiQ (UPF0313 family)
VAAFFDPMHSPRRTRQNYQEMRRFGLSTLAIGVESLHDPLLCVLGKQGEAEQLEEAIRRASAAGLRLRLILLVGPGDRALSQEHRRVSIQRLNKLPLGKNDIVYLSPIQERKGGYPFPTLTQDQTQQELSKFRSDLDRVTRARVMNYRIDNFHYYA